MYCIVLGGITVVFWARIFKIESDPVPLEKIDPNQKLGVHVIGDDKFVMGSDPHNSESELDGAMRRNPVIGKIWKVDRGRLDWRSHVQSFDKRGRDQENTATAVDKQVYCVILTASMC